MSRIYAPAAALLLACVLIIAACFYEAWEIDREDRLNPCVAYGAETTRLMLVGKLLIPVTERPCLKRKYEDPR